MLVCVVHPEVKRSVNSKKNSGFSIPVRTLYVSAEINPNIIA